MVEDLDRRFDILAQFQEVVWSCETDDFRENFLAILSQESPYCFGPVPRRILWKLKFGHCILYYAESVVVDEGLTNCFLVEFELRLYDPSLSQSYWADDGVGFV